MNEIPYTVFEVKAQDMEILELQERLEHCFTGSPSKEYVETLQKKLNLMLTEGGEDCEPEIPQEIFDRLKNL